MKFYQAHAMGYRIKELALRYCYDNIAVQIARDKTSGQGKHDLFGPPSAQ
jgi:hypothetical protein